MRLNGQLDALLRSKANVVRVMAYLRTEGGEVRAEAVRPDYLRLERGVLKAMVKGVVFTFWLSRGKWTVRQTKTFKGTTEFILEGRGPGWSARMAVEVKEVLVPKVRPLTAIGAREVHIAKTRPHTAVEAESRFTPIERW